MVCVDRVPFVEHAPPNKWNTYALEITFRRNTKIGGTKSFFLLKETVEHTCQSLIAQWRLRKFLFRHQQKHSVRKSTVHWQPIDRSNVSDARNLLETVDESREKSGFICLRLCIGPVRPGQRNVHGHDLVDTEAGINLEHFL